MDRQAEIAIIGNLNNHDGWSDGPTNRCPDLLRACVRGKNGLRDFKQELSADC
jgi:hypothetical protein